MEITVDLGAFVKFTGLIVMRSWCNLFCGLHHFESVVIWSPFLGLRIIELRISVVGSDGVHF